MSYDSKGEFVFRERDGNLILFKKALDAVFALSSSWQDESDKIGQLRKYSLARRLGKKVQQFARKER